MFQTHALLFFGSLKRFRLFQVKIGVSFQNIFESPVLGVLGGLFPALSWGCEDKLPECCFGEVHRAKAPEIRCSQNHIRFGAWGLEKLLDYFGLSSDIF